MKGNKLFTTVIDKDDAEGQKVTVKPSEYLKKLHPEKVISELEAHIQSLKDSLIRYSREDMDAPRNRKRIRKLGFELDVAKGYLSHFKKNMRLYGRTNGEPIPFPHGLILLLFR